MTKNITVYRVEDNVPLPDKGASLPPIHQLEPGQSILFPLEKRASVQSLASRVKRDTGWTFKVQKQNATSARVWRLE